MAKTEPLGVRLEPHVRRALEEAARADERPVSAMAAKLLAKALREAGWLTEDEALSVTR